MRCLIIVLAALLYDTTAHALTTDLVLSVDTSGTISVEVHLQMIAPSTKPSDAPFSLYILVLPFRASETATILAPEDLPVAILKRGNGYTLISAAVPVSRAETILRIADAFTLSESPEGKAYLSLDLTYPFISQADSQLMNAPFSVLPRNILVTLPRDFDETEVGYGPPQFQRIDKRRYSLDIQAAIPASRAWLVFPNPMERQLHTAKIVVATVIGLFTLFFHLPALKEQKLSWSIGVFVVSSLVCGLILYYSALLWKRLEFTEAVERFLNAEGV